MNLSAIRMIFFDAAGTLFRARGEIYSQVFPMTQHEPRD
jgi:FMN phosphatase YigB (HAD superfamily)